MDQSFSFMNVLVLLLFLAVMAWTSFTDIRSRIIPNAVIFPAIAIIIIIRLFHHPFGFAYYFAWGLLPAVLMLVASLLTKLKGFGAGDIKLMLFIGLALGGFGGFAAFVLGGMLSFLYNSARFVLFKKNMMESVRVAPFLFAGSLLWYLSPMWLVPLVERIFE
ncbi:prepilin peptidase [Paenibacillus elgii]|nr:prepilin peptidase [Paenibacillus elgii]